jgi:hypothetical protein
LVLASATSAQAPTVWRFYFQTGRELTYRVEQTTSASEVADGKTTETGSKLSNIKRWKVVGVDDNGVATLELSLLALRFETTTPSGEVMLFDSTHPEAGNAQMREQLAKYIGSPLAVLRVNEQGKVIEVKDCKYGAASRFESEPPFVLVLPAQGIREGFKTWDRGHQVTLAPPQGTGEKYDAIQHYTVQAVEDKLATIALATELKSLPEALADQVPLLPMQPTGVIVFDFQSGVMKSARLSIDKEIKGHHGEGSSYHFQTTYSERLQEKNN